MPVKHSCTGRRPSQVITSLTGHPRHSLATLQMCVFAAVREETWQGNYKSDRDTQMSFVMFLHSSLKQVETDIKRKSQIQNNAELKMSSVHPLVVCQ